MWKWCQGSTAATVGSRMPFQEGPSLWTPAECLVPCSNCPGMEQQGEDQNMSSQGKCIWASSAWAEESWLSCQQSCPLHKWMQEEGKKRVPQGKVLFSQCPGESLKTALVAKAFVSASSNTAAWRVFFERDFLVCFFQVSGVVCFEPQVASLESEQSVFVESG